VKQLFSFHITVLSIFFLIFSLNNSWGNPLISDSLKTSSDESYLSSEDYLDDFSSIYLIYEKYGYKDLSKNKEKSDEIKEIFEKVLSNLSGLTLEQFQKFDTNHKIGFWIDFYNATAIYFMVSFDLDILHKSLFVKNSNKIKIHSAYFEDPFFTVPYVNFSNIGNISLNDIVWGILIGDKDYLLELEEGELEKGMVFPEKTEAIRTFHESIEYKNGELDPILLFYLTCGAPVWPEFELNSGLHTVVSCYDLEGRDRYRSEIVLKEILSDRKKGFDLSVVKEHLLWGNIEGISIRLPYIFKVFEKPIINFYGSFENFICDYLPDEDDRLYLNDNPDGGKNGFTYSFQMDTRLLFPGTSGGKLTTKSALNNRELIQPTKNR